MPHLRNYSLMLAENDNLKTTHQTLPNIMMIIKTTGTKVSVQRTKSPHQLVFGQNPNLCFVLTDKPPALEGTACNAWAARHMLDPSGKVFTEKAFSE